MFSKSISVHTVLLGLCFFILTYYYKESIYLILLRDLFVSTLKTTKLQ